MHGMVATKNVIESLTTGLSSNKYGFWLLPFGVPYKPVYNDHQMSQKNSFPPILAIFVKPP
jgi:hypothetical protein